MTSWAERLSRGRDWLDDAGHARTVLVLLLAVALAARLAAALALPLDYKLVKDAAAYVAIGRNVAVHRVFGPTPETPYALIPPGYPLFVAAVLWCTGHSLLAVRLAQVVLATLMVWQTYMVARAGAGRPAALTAAALVALYPPWVVWPCRFLTEPLYGVLLLAFVWGLLRSTARATPAWAAFTGVAFALALLTREMGILLPALMPAALWWTRKRLRPSAVYLAVFLAAALVTVLPWLVRNYQRFGSAFYTERTEAIRYRLTGRGYLSPRYRYLVDPSAANPVAKRPEYWQRYGKPSEWVSVRFLLEHPCTYCLHAARRLRELWLHPNGLASLPASALARWPYAAFHWVLLALALGAGVVGLRRRHGPTGILVALVLYDTVVLLLLSKPHPRYTLPLLPLVFVLAAQALAGLSARWRAGRADANRA